MVRDALLLIRCSRLKLVILKVLHDAVRRNSFFFFVLRLTQPSFLLSLMFEGDSVMSMWGLYKQEADNQFHSVDGGKPAVLQVG